MMKQQLKSILLRHEGRVQAIKAQELAEIVQCDERKVRLIIRELIAEGLPVASGTEPPAGYFVVNTWQEASQYAQSIKGRLIEEAIRRRDFRRSAALYLKPAEQARML